MSKKSLKRTLAVLQSDFDELCVRFAMYVAATHWFASQQHCIN